MPKILIVDDSGTIRKMVRSSLRPLGEVEFVEAGNGLEAIEQIALGPVALIIPTSICPICMAWTC